MKSIRIIKVSDEEEGKFNEEQEVEETVTENFLELRSVGFNRPKDSSINKAK